MGLAGPQRQIAKRVSRQARIWRVLRMKMAGATDRDIRDELANDPEQPVRISHAQVNHDWHDALNDLTERNRGQAQRLRMLMGIRLERLLMTQWAKATAPGAPASAVEMCRRIIKDQTELFGLAREIGDEDRPLTFQDADEQEDYDGLSDSEHATLLAIAERQEAARLALGPGQAEAAQP